jgi:hypothetical protein
MFLARFAVLLFKALRSLIARSIAIRLQCSPISEDWLDGYKEATRPPHQPGWKKAPVVIFNLTFGEDIDTAIKERTKQHGTSCLC